MTLKVQYEIKYKTQEYLKDLKNITLYILDYPDKIDTEFKHSLIKKITKISTKICDNQLKILKDVQEIK